MKFYLIQENGGTKKYLSKDKLWVAGKKNAFLNEATDQEFINRLASKYSAKVEMVPEKRGKS